MMLYYSTVISLINDTEFITEFTVNISEYFFKGKYLRDSDFPRSRNRGRNRGIRHMKRNPYSVKITVT